VTIPLETFPWNIQDHLKTPEEQAGYLAVVLEDGTPDDIAAALGHIAKARGVTAFAASAGLSREVVYKGLRPGGNPTLETLTKAVAALGLRLAVVPQRQTAPRAGS
jgi:probable addiction module antidote protein